MAIYRKIRRSQYIFPSGVGALYDISDESMIAMDISKWKPNYGEKLNLKRLEQLLRVNHFKMPESHSDMGNKKYSTAKDKLPFLRFPQWLFCRSCGTMIQWSRQKDIDKAMKIQGIFASKAVKYAKKAQKTVDSNPKLAMTHSNFKYEKSGCVLSITI